jgi:AraC-like DNA-binding protein
MARPVISIDQKIFENLCFLQCTLEEIAKAFGCSADTIERWCKKTYDLRFADVYKQKAGDGRIALRRFQFRLAEKNVAMAIWLGKQWLGQYDKQEETRTEKIQVLNDVPKKEETDKDE